MLGFFVNNDRVTRPYPRTLKTGTGCGGTGNGVVGGSVVGGAGNGSRESPDEGIQDDCSTDV